MNEKICGDLIQTLQRDLAECYRLSGADPDGNEDWRLAEEAVAEVRRMRAEFDATANALLVAEQTRNAAQTESTKNVELRREAERMARLLRQQLSTVTQAYNLCADECRAVRAELTRMHESLAAHKKREAGR